MPRIAIPLPTLADAEYNHRSWNNYANAVREAGGEPVEFSLTSSPAEHQALAATCHGVCLPGSPADVDPFRFGAEREEACNPADPAREALDYLLLNDAEKNGKPVLGICFGVQSMNVWRGGTLVQDVLPTPVNHSAGAQVKIAHTALISKASFLATLVDPAEGTDDGDFLRLPINSSHHQAVASPGDGLRIVARCPEDGVIEAIEADPSFPMADTETPPRFLVGLQWHPERTTDISATSRNIFRRLVTEAAAYEAAH
jgi:putative glutamine amidotransferase